MLRKTTIKILQGTEDLDPMLFKKLLERRRTQKTFSKLDDFSVGFVATKRPLTIADSLEDCVHLVS